MGLFFYNKIGSIISIGDLPTTNIIEPIFRAMKILFLKFSKFRNPKAFRLMSLMRLLVASNLPLE